MDRRSARNKCTFLPVFSFKKLSFSKLPELESLPELRSDSRSSLRATTICCYALFLKNPARQCQKDCLAKVKGLYTKSETAHNSYEVPAKSNIHYKHTSTEFRAPLVLQGVWKGVLEEKQNLSSIAAFRSPNTRMRL